jgi:hypothetical protein
MSVRGPDFACFASATCSARQGSATEAKTIGVGRLTAADELDTASVFGVQHRQETTFDPGQLGFRDI